MLPKLSQIDFKWFPIGLIVIYAPFHIIEEAINNFPLWMFEHYKLPKPLSYPHWLINNLVFLIILLLGLIIYFRNKTKNLFFGVGIVIWAFMNSLEHIIFTIYDFKISPGFYTAIIFFTVSIIGLMKLRSEHTLKPKLLLKSLLVAISYWIVSFVIIILMGFYLVKLFPG